jgi:hypothetical protein
MPMQNFLRDGFKRRNSVIVWRFASHRREQTSQTSAASIFPLKIPENGATGLMRRLPS